MSNINYTAFKRLPQWELKTFADLVFQKTNGVAAYAPFQTAITALEPIALAYQQALINAADGGKDRVAKKDKAKDDLIQQLTKIGKLMDAEWTNDDHDDLKSEAGYTLVRAPKRIVVDFVNTPTNFKVFNDPRKGVINLKWDEVPNARTYALEELQEDGTWKNGVYSEKPFLQLTNLPEGKKMTFHIKTVGPDTIVSGWTPSVSVWVD